MIAETTVPQMQHDDDAPSRHSRAADLHTPVPSGTTPADDAARQQREPQSIVIKWHGRRVDPKTGRVPVEINGAFVGTLGIAAAQRVTGRMTSAATKHSGVRCVERVARPRAAQGGR